MKILIVDSHNDQRPGARLPQVVGALGRFVAHGEGFRSVRRPSDGSFHDLAAYDLALVHESDARLDNGAFYKLCVRTTTPCVLYSGGTDRAAADSPRLLILSDRDLLRHAEDGILFWQRTVRLDLTAWTQGLRAAVQEEAHRLCEPLRKLLRGVRGPGPAERQALTLLPNTLRSWCGVSEEGMRSLEELSAILRTLQSSDDEASGTWLATNRAFLSSLLPQVIAQAR